MQEEVADTRTPRQRRRAFVREAEDIAFSQRKSWTRALHNKVAAIARNDALTWEEKSERTLALIDAAPSFWPVTTIEELLEAIGAAALSYGIELTIALRADLRAALEDKPVPLVAHQRTLEIFAKHKDMQQIQAIGALQAQTRH